jgi:REP element-mobilizing transposase RayT
MITELNLPDAPRGFLRLNPDVPVKVYFRHLPHWRQDGATYFVTFRLADSLPQVKLQYLKRLRMEWERTHPLPRNEQAWRDFAIQVTNMVERWLDEGYGACYFRERRWSDDLRDRLNYFQDDRYFLSCYAIMPNHCHLLILPNQKQDLEDLLGAMKGVNARHINQTMDCSKAIWEEESYDRIVRDEEHLWRVIQYIGRNPRLAGLANEAVWRRWVHPDWEAAGWGFCDEA